MGARQSKACEQLAPKNSLIFLHCFEKKRTPCPFALPMERHVSCVALFEGVEKRLTAGVKRRQKPLGRTLDPVPCALDSDYCFSPRQKSTD